MLSDQDKERIRAEIEHRELVARERQESLARRVSAALSHPFVLTVLGGILIVIIGAVLHEQQQQRLMWRQQQLETKHTLLTNFNEPLKKYLVLLYNLRLNQAFLIRTTDQDKGTTDQDYLGRDRDEVKTLYKSIVTRLIEGRRGMAALVSVRARFRSDKVLDVVSDLERLIRSLQKDYPLSEKQIDDLSDQIDAKVQTLVIAMRDEIDRDMRIETDK